jgi:hypothetical protein
MKVSDLTINGFLLEKTVSSGKVTIYSIKNITEDHVYFEYADRIASVFSHPKKELAYIFETHKVYDYFVAKTEAELLALKLKIC